MSIKIYIDHIPENIINQMKILNIIANKDQVRGVYVNTFLGKIREAYVLTPDKLIAWKTRMNGNEKNIISFKKIKDITYFEKGIYGTITYHISSKKTYELKLNRQDSEKFLSLSTDIWNK
ncbi:MAG: hypothetical protein ACOYVD_03280 [Bacillota bacterium]